MFFHILCCTCHAMSSYFSFSSRKNMEVLYLPVREQWRLWRCAWKQKKEGKVKGSKVFHLEKIIIVAPIHIMVFIPCQCCVLLTEISWAFLDEMLSFSSLLIQNGTALWKTSGTPNPFMWLGRQLLHWVSCCHIRHKLLSFLFISIFMFLCNPCYVNANSSRVWQAPGVAVTLVCEVMLPPSVIRKQAVHKWQFAVTHSEYLVFRKRAGAAPSWHVLNLLSLVTADLFVVSFMSWVFSNWISWNEFDWILFVFFFLHSTESGSEPSQRGHRDSRGPITRYHWTYDMSSYSHSHSSG